MKEYKLDVPDYLQKKKKEVLEYLVVCHYADEIFTAGSCGIVLGVDKYDFRYGILPKYEHEVV